MAKMDHRSTEHDDSGDHDVFFGRGGLGNLLRRHSLYRELIEKNFKEYKDKLTHSKEKRAFAQTRVVDAIIMAGGKFYNEERSHNGSRKLEFKELNPDDADDANLILTKIMQAFRDMGRGVGRPKYSTRHGSRNREKNKAANALTTSKKVKVGERSDQHHVELRNQEEEDGEYDSSSFSGSDDYSPPSVSSSDAFSFINADEGAGTCKHGSVEEEEAMQEEQKEPQRKDEEDKVEEEVKVDNLERFSTIGSLFDDTSYCDDQLEWYYFEEDENTGIGGYTASPPSPSSNGGDQGRPEEGLALSTLVERVNSRINRLECLVCFLMKENEALRSEVAKHNAVAL
jgi:hypothetical protein